jgi:hypothetical protein
MIISQVKLIDNNRLATYAKHAMKSQSTSFSTINFDYQVVILNITINLIWPSEMALLGNDCSEQASPITEGVVKIRINIHLAREITWQHHTRQPQRHHEWPPFMLTIKESGRILHHSSASLPRDNSMGIHGWPTHYPSVHSWGKVRYHSNQRPSKLLSLWDPINPVCTNT